MNKTSAEAKQFALETKGLVELASKNNIDIGDPVEMARKYYEQGVDELVFYDIMASARGRGPILDLISRVAEQVLQHEARSCFKTRGFRR